MAIPRRIAAICGDLTGIVNRDVVLVSQDPASLWID